MLKARYKRVNKEGQHPGVTWVQLIMMHRAYERVSQIPWPSRLRKERLTAVLLFIAVSLVVDLRYLLYADDIVDTDKYYMASPGVALLYLKHSLSPYSPDYLGILKYNYDVMQPLSYLLYWLVSIMGLPGTVVIPFLLRVLLMVSMYLLLERLVDNRLLRIIGALAYGLNPVSTSYYMAVPIVFLPVLIPLTLASFIDLYRSPTRRNIILAGISASLLLTLHIPALPALAIILLPLVAYMVLFSGNRTLMTKALVIVGVIFVLVSLPTILHQFILHFDRPDSLLNYISRGIDPKTVKADIRYCYRTLDLGQMLTLAGDPCHRITHKIYDGTFYTWIHGVMVLSTLGLSIAVLLGGRREAILFAAVASTVVTSILVTIIIMRIYGIEYYSNLIVMALRSPVKVRVVAEPFLVAGTVVLVDMLLHRGGSRIMQVLSAVLALSLIIFSVPYIYNNFKMNTYFTEDKIISHLVETRSIELNARGIILPYTHRNMLNAPPSYRPLPLYPKPPIVDYLKESYYAHSLGYALHALGVSNVVVKIRDNFTSYYDLMSSNEFNASYALEMLTQQGYSEKIYSGKAATVLRGGASTLEIYDKVFLLNEPDNLKYVAYLLNHTGYMPSIIVAPVKLHELDKYLDYRGTYIVSPLYLGSNLHGLRLISDGYPFIYYIEGKYTRTLNITSLRVGVSPGSEELVVWGSMFNIIVSSGSRFNLSVTLDGAGSSFYLVYNKSGVYCSITGTTYSMKGPVIVTYDSGGIRVVISGKIVCKLDKVRDPARVYISSLGSRVDVTVSLLQHGLPRIYYAALDNGYYLVVYRYAYNSLAKPVGVNYVNSEPLLVDGYANGWITRGDRVYGVSRGFENVYPIVSIVSWLVLPLFLVYYVFRVVNS